MYKSLALVMEHGDLITLWISVLAGSYVRGDPSDDVCRSAAQHAGNWAYQLVGVTAPNTLT